MSSQYQFLPRARPAILQMNDARPSRTSEENHLNGFSEGQSEMPKRQRWSPGRTASEDPLAKRET